MGVLSWGGQVSSKFWAPLVVKLYVRSTKVLEAQECARGPLSPRQVWLSSYFSHSLGDQKRWVFLFVHPSEIVHMMSPWRLWSTETTLIPLGWVEWSKCLTSHSTQNRSFRGHTDTVGWGKVCSCATTFNFLHMPPQLVKPQNTKFKKWQNLRFTTTWVLLNKPT